MTKGPEIVNMPPGARIVMKPIHVTFTTCKTVWRRVNGVDVPDPPYQGYNPDAFVLLKDSEAGDDTSN